MFWNKKDDKRIYLDYAASTPIREEVKKVLLESLGFFANPGTLHKEGVLAKQKLEETRAKIATAIFARQKEIIFTSGATESNNLAILGLVKNWQKNNPNKTPHIIVSKIEHPSILEVCKKLEKEGVEVTYLDVLENGLIDIKKFKNSLKENTILVSVIFASNEIGVIQPILEISKEIRHFKKYNLKNHLNIFPVLHTDASQAPMYDDINVQKIHVDMMTISSEKIYGPKGVSALFVKDGVKIDKILEGGSQEFNLRAGTENVPSILAFAKALELAVIEREIESARIREIQNYCFTLLEKNFSGKFILNGSREQRLPNNVNITFPNFDSELLVIELDAKGIAVSEKSACNTEDEESYVIENLRKENTGSIRISFGKDTTKSQIDFLIKSLKEILEKYKNFHTK